MIRLLVLILLLVTATFTPWLLSNSKIFSSIFTSPNQTLADLDASLNESSKQLLSKWHDLFDHQPVISKLSGSNRNDESNRNNGLDRNNELSRNTVFSGANSGAVNSTKKYPTSVTATHLHPSTKISNTKILNTKILTATEAAMLARADALCQVGLLPEAIQEYLKLINLNPNLAIAHHRLGLVAVSDNNLWLAISELQKAAQLDKKNADTQNDLGLVYKQFGDFKLAELAFLNAHRIAPKHLSASVNLANSVADRGNYRAAIGIMRQATNDHPNSPLAHNNLASLIARTNNQTQAAKEFAKAIDLDSTLASAHYGLGIALLKLKSYTAAVKEFQNAMTLNPGILDLQDKIDLANRCYLRTLAYSQQSFN